MPEPTTLAAAIATHELQGKFVLDPVLPPIRKAPSMVEKILGIAAAAVAVAHTVVEEVSAVVASPDRVGAVTDEAMKLVRAAEAKENLLPAGIEGVVMTAIEFSLRHYVVPRLVGKAEQSGILAPVHG